MWLHYRNIQYLEASARPDDVNEKILNGDYLDKSQEDFIMPNQDKMMKYIFSDWQKGDILVIADSPLQYPKKQGNILVEMTREEICQSGDLSVLFEGEYFEDGKIIKVEYNQELGFLKQTWNRELKEWIEGATDIEKVQAQINEYSELDTPSTLKEMGTELANECMDMLIQLRNMAYTLGNPATIEDRDLLVLPKPSEKLKQFKNKYNLIK